MKKMSLNNSGNKIAVSVFLGAALVAAALYFGLTKPKPSFLSNQTMNQISPTVSILPTMTPTSSSPAKMAQKPPSSSPAKEISWKKSDLITALSQKTGISENEIKFSVGQEIKKEGKILLNGSVSREGEMGGAAFFAVVDQGGVKITFTGQGVPNCAEVNPYGYPISWVDYCVDQGGNTVAR